MPPAVKPKGMLSGFISDDEDDTQFMERAMPTPDSAAEKHAPATKARAKPKGTANNVAKTKPTKRAATATSSRVNKKRKPLTDKANETPVSDSEEEKADQQEDSIMAELISDDELGDLVIPVKKSKITKKRDVPAKSSSDTPASPPRPEVRKKKAGRPKKHVPPEPEKKHEEEEKEEPEEIEETMPLVPETQAVLSEPEEVSKPAARKEIPRGRFRSESRTAPIPRKRAGSASDTERSDPTVRRKLGEANKKVESLEFKYRNLHEIGVKQAEENFEKLRAQSEVKTKAANELIAALKADLKESKATDKELLKLTTRVTVADAEILALKTQLESLSASLRESQAENKSLSTKLAASRSAAASVESASTRVPGSAKKAMAGVRMVGSAEAAQAASAAQLKEHLYGDLTGLVILGVKQEDGEDVYDCIQTGRNGTLHFKLAATAESASESYEDAQCSYIPQLDPSRDRELVGLLPDYLVDEIAFPRPQASKFYARVVKALYERGE